MLYSPFYRIRATVCDPDGHAIAILLLYVNLMVALICMNTVGIILWMTKMQLGLNHSYVA